MLFLLIPIVFIFLIEICIKKYKPDIAKNIKQMKFIRSLELAFFSPFLTIGMLMLKKESIYNNLWLVFMLTLVFIILSVRNYYDYKNNFL